MSENTDLDQDARVRELEAEVGAMRQRLEQREQLLRVLNRRLLQLEHGENGISGMDRAAETGRLASENTALQEEIRALKDELGSLHATKLFRWSSPARGVYARLRQPR